MKLNLNTAKRAKLPEGLGNGGVRPACSSPHRVSQIRAGITAAVLSCAITAHALDRVEARPNGTS